MSFMLLGILNSAAAAAGGVKNFIMEFTSSQGMNYPKMQQDIDGNYVFTYSYYDSSAATPGNYFFVHYFDADLNLVWSQQYTDSLNKGAYGYSAVFDANGNIVVSCKLNNSTASAFLLSKSNGFPSIRKSWVYKNQGSMNVGVTSMATNSARNKFLIPGGYNNSSGQRRSAVAQLDSSLGIDYVTAENVSSTSNYYADAVAFDSSDNAYMAGLSNQNNYQGCLVFRVNTDGSFAWAQKLGSDDNVAIRGMAIIGTSIYTINESYIVEKINTSNGSKTQVSRLDYNIPWQPIAWGDADSFYGLALHSNGQEIIKLNTSLGTTWSRRLSISGVTMQYGNHMAGVATPDGDIMVSGRFDASGTEGAFFMKIPPDGSLTQSVVVGSRTYTYGIGSAVSMYSYPLLQMPKTAYSEVNNATTTYGYIKQAHTPTYAFGEM